MFSFTDGGRCVGRARFIVNSAPYLWKSDTPNLLAARASLLHSSGFEPALAILAPKIAIASRPSIGSGWGPRVSERLSEDVSSPSAHSSRFCRQSHPEAALLLSSFVQLPVPRGRPDKTPALLCFDMPASGSSAAASSATAAGAEMFQEPRGQSVHARAI